MRAIVDLPFAWRCCFASSSARAQGANELLQACEGLERTMTFAGENISFPPSQTNDECWYFMSAVQQYSTLAAPGGQFLGACTEPTTTLFAAHSRLHQLCAFPSSTPQRDSYGSHVQRNAIHVSLQLNSLASHRTKEGAVGLSLQSITAANNYTERCRHGTSLGGTARASQVSTGRVLAIRQRGDHFRLLSPKPKMSGRVCLILLGHRDTSRNTRAAPTSRPR